MSYIYYILGPLIVTSALESMKMASLKKFIDIGANLIDPMYSGIYHGSKKHEADLKDVLERSWSNGLSKIIVTGGSLTESKAAIDLANSNDNLYATVGCHPTRCNEFEDDAGAYLANLKSLAENERKVVAIGECGLDYDRLQFCAKETQQKYFEMQLPLSRDLGLPLFLHCRNAASDLVAILKRYSGLRGVVHSFDGSADEVKSFTDMGFYIGINGCSLKTEDNLKTVATIPKDHLLLETDSPWCEIRPTHAGNKYVKTRFPNIKKEKWNSDYMVKGRNEPSNIWQVFEVVAAVRNEDPEELCETVHQNTLNLFFNKK